jgi:anti-anti-sigma regulatory factor
MPLGRVLRNKPQGRSLDALRQRSWRISTMHSPVSAVVDLGRAPSIRTVAELRASLIGAIAAHETVVVSAEQATSIDISVLQVLASAHRTAGAAGKTLTLVGPGDGALQTALRQAGFVSAAGEPLCREGVFWTPAAAKDAAA